MEENTYHKYLVWSEMELLPTDKGKDELYDSGVEWWTQYTNDFMIVEATSKEEAESRAKESIEDNLLEERVGEYSVHVYLARDDVESDVYTESSGILPDNINLSEMYIQAYEQRGVYFISEKSFDDLERQIETEQEKDTFPPIGNPLESIKAAKNVIENNKSKAEGHEDQSSSFEDR